jgi:hypothetical protein
MADEADDLRSLLSTSFDQSMTAAETGDATKVDVKPAEVATGSVADAAATSDTKTGDAVRGKDGKFLKKDAAAETADAVTEVKPEAKEQVKKEDSAEKTEAVAKPDGKEAPVNWSASDKAMFKLQSEDGQAFLLRRHRAMEADYTKKVEAIADLRKEYDPVQQMFAPYVDVLKQKGLTPQTVIRRWSEVETALANGRGIDIISGIITGYGIDKAALGKALGFTAAAHATKGAERGAENVTHATAETAAHQPINLPPELTEELRQLRAKIDARENADRDAQAKTARDREVKVETDITNFKSAANDKGDLLHPFYDEVEPAMIALAQSHVASKQTIPPLGELYETAVWANPSTRAAMLAAQRTAEQARIAEEARAKAASARRAGSSVTGAPGSGQATRAVRSELSLREQLEEAAANTG